MATDEIHLRDEDRLPWLETVEPDEPRRPGAGRIVVLALLGLAILAALVFAALRIGAPTGTHDTGGALIRPQDGDYKVKPDNPGGLKVSGEGDAAIATSTGTGGGGATIDPRQVPETPIAGRHGAAGPVATTGGASAIAAVPANGGRLTAPPPMAAPRAPVPGASSGGAMVQLGAFPSEGVANASWAAMAKRFSYVATLAKSVEQADVAGRHVFRLRVDAGSAAAAADVCGRLKVAGEGCFVVAR